VVKTLLRRRKPRPLTLEEKRLREISANLDAWNTRRRPRLEDRHTLRVTILLLRQSKASPLLTKALTEILCRVESIPADHPAPGESA